MLQIVTATAKTLGQRLVHNGSGRPVGGLGHSAKTLFKPASPLLNTDIHRTFTFA